MYNLKPFLNMIRVGLSLSEEDRPPLGNIAIVDLLGIRVNEARICNVCRIVGLRLLGVFE